jgi:hypothetical protein
LRDDLQLTQLPFGPSRGPRIVRDRWSSLREGQPQRQKHALTQMRGAGCDGEQPHISFGPVHSLSLVHSL